MGRRAVSARASLRELVLVGGGHAHVQVVRRFMMRPVDGVRLTLVVDRYEAVYSGMVPGLVAGDYRADELVIDVRPLVRRAGARCLQARATGIDPYEKRVLLEGRPSIAYDVASLDVGSTVRGLDLPGVREHAVATRPIAHFVESVEARIAGLPAERPARAVVVGGGAAGIELSLCLDARLRAAGHAVELTLIAASDSLLPGGHAHLTDRVRAEARGRGITIRPGERVVAVEPDAVLVDGGSAPPERIASDLTLWATGAAPPAWLADTKLPVNPSGFLRVDEHLAVPGCPDLFAAGDCAVPDHATWVPRAGVYAVRQGPVLDRNLRARLESRPLRRYTPQRDFLALLNAGGGRAIGGKWGIGATGRAVFLLKDWIDRRFVRRFQVLDAKGRPAPHFPSPEEMADADEMVCGGCAAKVGPAPLRAALARLDPAPPDASVIVGLSEADDAATLALPGGDRLLATIDAFRAFTDDPWLVGRVAAINAASDVLAKGGRPRHALALVSVADDEPARQAETLYQVMAGIRAGLDPLGVSLVGGHSTTGPELFVGLSITGTPAPGGRVLGLDGLQPGDRLVLTRPLGSGVLWAADMRGLAAGPWIEALTEQMLRDGAATVRAALQHPVRACTDVSGFGLAGHLLDLLERSAVAADLYVDAIPVAAGVRTLLDAGVRSTFHAQNVTARDRVEPDAELAANDLELLFDPQTAGGLLFAVPAAACDALLEAVRAAGEAEASAIGVVRAPTPGAPPIRLRAGAMETRGAIVAQGSPGSRPCPPGAIEP
jgi:selenide,water dikinase